MDTENLFTWMALLSIIGFVLVLVVGVWVFGPKGECLKYEEEEYYDSTGIVLWGVTGNPGMIAMNGYKTRNKCVEWKSEP